MVTSEKMLEVAITFITGVGLLLRKASLRLCTSASTRETPTHSRCLWDLSSHDFSDV